MICKAETLDGKIVKGWLVEDVIYPATFRLYRDGEKIKPETLEYSFEDGKTWHKEEYINKCLDFIDANLDEFNKDKQ